MCKETDYASNPRNNQSICNKIQLIPPSNHSYPQVQAFEILPYQDGEFTPDSDSLTSSISDLSEVTNSYTF